MKQTINNTDKLTNTQWIWRGLIVLVVLGATGVLVLLSTIRNLSSMESVLLQVIFLAIGCWVSYWVGQKSVKMAAKELVKNQAKSAFRRLIFLYLTLRKAANMIDLSDGSDSQEEYEMLLARLEEIVAAQLITADHALEDWNDIVPEEVEELKQELQYNDTRRMNND